MFEKTCVGQQKVREENRYSQEKVSPLSRNSLVVVTDSLTRVTVGKKMVTVGYFRSQPFNFFITIPLCPT